MALYPLWDHSTFRGDLPRRRHQYKSVITSQWHYFPIDPTGAIMRSCRSRGFSLPGGRVSVVAPSFEWCFSESMSDARFSSVAGCGPSSLGGGVGAICPPLPSAIGWAPVSEDGGARVAFGVDSCVIARKRARTCPVFILSFLMYPWSIRVINSRSFSQPFVKSFLLNFICQHIVFKGVDFRSFVSHALSVEIYGTLNCFFSFSFRPSIVYV